MDAIEAVTNATLGLIISILAVYLLWPLFGWVATPSQSFIVTAIFWALSTIRAYAIRKLFRFIS